MVKKNMPDGARVIAIVSGKGGVGKTTTAANLGVGLAWNYKEDVILIDANTTSSGLGLHLGKYWYEISLNDVLNGKAHISQAMYAHPSGARLIPATTHLDNLDTDPKELKKVTKSLKPYVDYILLDCAPTLGDESTAGIDAADEIILVTNNDWPSLLEAKRTLEYAKHHKKAILGVILNKSPPLNDAMREKLEATLGVPVLGTIKNDEKVTESITRRVPVIHSFPYANAASDYVTILETVTGEKFYGKTSFFGKLLSRVGLKE
ncbi:hypothetical protein COT72_03635 [archaeon CG10_big_fil_rev_8_21_14_0_10_43_11]|nr:MAG: hypothetical protein COT72_03635 [archaeon CG10_big_fil_rev_8_21_14_0_10_43_11]